jgi:hypothetical protein
MSLNIIGSTQPQLSVGTIAAMAQELQDSNRADVFLGPSGKTEPVLSV